MIVPFEAEAYGARVRYEFDEDTWRRISAGDSDAPMPVLRELLKMRMRQLAEKQALLDQYAQRVMDLDAEVAMLRQREETV